MKVNQLFHRYQEHKATRQAVHEAVSVPTETEHHSVDEAEVERLCEAFFRKKLGGNSGARPKQKAKQSSRLLTDPKGEICPHHFTFGAQSNNCSKAKNGACKFPGNARPGR